MKKRIFMLLMLTLALSLVLVACGEETGTTPDESDNDEGNNEETSGDKTLIFARGGDSVSLDPATTTDGETSRVTRQIFESLLEFEADSFEVKPGLATDYEILDDGQRYRLELREDVQFHDGTDFNADAVIFNFERWSDPEHPHHYADEGFTYVFYGNQFGGFKGDEDHIIESIEKIDEYTIEFVLKRPSAPFLQNLAMSAFGIASPQSFEEHGADVIENPVGTGPFVFKSWKRNDTITLEKNENYWQEGYPLLDTVIFQVIPDNSARFTALMAGDIDLMDGLNPDDVTTVEADGNLELYKRAPNNVGYLGFNTQKAPFDNEQVRVAMNHAVNKEALISALYRDLGVTAKNPLPPGYLGYNDTISEYEYDPEKAKALLAEAGYEDGFEFELWTMPVARPYMPDPQKAAEALQADFAEVGLTAKVISKEWATYLDETQQGLQDVYMLGWSGTNGDPDYFVNNLLSADAIPGGNRSFYDNEEVTALFNDAVEETDVDARDAMYQQALEIVHQEAPWIPLVHNTPVLAGSDRVINYIPHPSTSEVLTHVDVE
ncbi:ABC transporter substrate-binding protein [Caldalkalibacillus salinus]|uniref:ABC transporter substrate-binding protein n=1 Tax=Caldalkalibacillus salinus TaxID=2803787 RepID=UPI0019228658|nr:ABC transporter substrate-binding protein [Caldalkalibacillus salinus]